MKLGHDCCFGRDKGTANSQHTNQEKRSQKRSNRQKHRSFFFCNGTTTYNPIWYCNSFPIPSKTQRQQAMLHSKQQRDPTYYRCPYLHRRREWEEEILTSFSVNKDMVFLESHLLTNSLKEKRKNGEQWKKMYHNPFQLVFTRPNISPKERGCIHFSNDTTQKTLSFCNHSTVKSPMSYFQPAPPISVHFRRLK